METNKPSFSKQYADIKINHQQYRKDNVTKTNPDMKPDVNLHLTFGHVNKYAQTEKYHDHSCGRSQSTTINEEPIDLTTFSSKENDSYIERKNHEENLVYSSQDVPSGQYSVCYPKRRRKKRKFAYTPDGKLVLVPNDENLQSPASFSESKQLEILKAAKSLFSKRTRTLYHWMYPNAAKPQIKAAVTSSWESLGAQEKDFYISQVLGRFGFPQSSLMVNPQLGGIKDLPIITEPSEPKSKSRELQSAISSIMPENPMPPELCTSSLTFEEFEEINELTKKRRGRPPGSSNKKHKYSLSGGVMTQEFKDDPELSQELEQFATMFNLSKF